MSEGSLFGEPGGCSDDAARIAALEAELRATRLESEARRVENDQLRGELAAERARAVSGDAAGEGVSGGAAPSPDAMAGMRAHPQRWQADLTARAAGADIGDVRVVGRDLVEVIEAAWRLQAFGFAIQAEALAGLNQVQHLPVLPAGVSSAAMRTETLTGAEAAAGLLVSRDAARARTADALMLTRVFSRTLGALRAGWITDWHARILLAETAHLDDNQRLRVEDAVLDDADGRTGPELRRKIKQVVARIAPRDTEEAHARAREDRRVWAQPGLDGMGTLGAELPIEDLAAVMTAIEAAAAAAKTTDPDDGRSMDNRRADALAAMGWTALTTGHIGHGPATTSTAHNGSTSASAGASTETGDEPARGCCCGAVNTASTPPAAAAGGGLRLQNTRGKPVTVNVTVPYSTLIGIDEHPGELAGYGTIAAHVARRIATHGTWRRILTDPVNGAPLDYGHTRYRPPPDLAAFIALRDRRCTFPGCSRTAQASQIDHTIPYADGGTTAHHNLGSLCQVCHLLKTFTNWSATQNPHRPGQFDWTSPLGNTHTVQPDPVGPILQPP